MHSDSPPAASMARERRFLNLFLPYSVRTESVDVDYAQVMQRFLARNHTVIAFEVKALLGTVKRQYRLTATSDTVRVAGPYGYKAWTMQTTIAITPAGHLSVLTIWTYPHYRLTLAVIAVLVLISVFAIAASMPLAPLFPLGLFAPLLYGAIVVATKIEAAAIAGLVRGVACDTVHREEAQAAEP
jgi:hypothetical protein